MKGMLKSFPRTFWISNGVELLERWAWYGMYMVLGLYLTGSRNAGALGFSQSQKGLLMGSVSAMIYLLPFFTGAIADKIGYKKTLIFAFSLYILGFLAMANLQSYTWIFIAFVVVGLGAAFFKPIVSATISKTTNENNSSVGFGIFYMMVNIGAFIGPVFASKFKQINWQMVFYFSALIIFVNVLAVLFFYKEPGQTEKTDTETAGDAMRKIFKNIINVFKDWNFIIFLLLIVAFWAMYNQLFLSLPIFIDYWIDTHSVYHWLNNFAPWLAKILGDPEKQIIPAEIMTDLDAFYIILFQIPIAYFVKRFKPIHSITGGILMATIGMSLAFMFRNPFYLFITLIIFSVGEMASSPKITEYIGRIAPDDKKGLYMGMSFLPVAGGNLLAGIIAGKPFEYYSDKFFLLKKELMTRGISIPEFSENFTKDDLWRLGMEKLHLTSENLTSFLWDKYHPQNIWYVFAAIGIITVIGLIVYDKIVTAKKIKQ